VADIWRPTAVGLTARTAGWLELLKRITFVVNEDLKKGIGYLLGAIGVKPSSLPSIIVILNSVKCTREQREKKELRRATSL